MKRFTWMASTLAVAGLLQGCAAPGRAIDNADQARAVAAQPAAPAPADFPALDKARWKQGTFPAIDNLRAMRAGMGKDQVRDLLGPPHFSEGLWRVREWNYIFHFRTGSDAQYRTCQYMVRYDDAELSTGSWWKDPSCAALLQAPAPAVMTRAEPPTVLAADGLFRFDRSSLQDLQPAGRVRIEGLAAKWRSFPGTSSGQVKVTGHTDRLGDAAANDALSLRRAQTVRALLVQEGIPAQRVQAFGAGEREPVTTGCRGDAATPALIACLAPDRRVEVQMTTAP